MIHTIDKHSTTIKWIFLKKRIIVQKHKKSYVFLIYPLNHK